MERRRGRPRHHRLAALALLLTALVLTGLTGVAAPAGATPPPQSPEPSSYVLVDADTGIVLQGKDLHTPQSPASTVKLMTALAALDRLRLDSTVPVSALAAGQPAMKIDMREGQVWPLDQALHALLIVSANDAAYAIAERAGGDVAGFAKRANALMDRIGATDGTFADPAGLDGPAAYGGGSTLSAWDLAVIARNALSIPAIADVTKLLHYEFVDPTGAARRLTNHNDRLLTTYPGANGLKTGFTDRAGRTLVASATRDGRTMIAVVFGTYDTSGWAAQLMDQGFATPVASEAGGTELPPALVQTADERATAVPRGTEPASATRPAGSATKQPAEVASTSSGGRRTILVLVGIVVLLLLVFVLLRRRAIRRRRKRRLARQRALQEARRRGMIHVVDDPRRTVVPRQRPGGPT